MRFESQITEKRVPAPARMIRAALAAVLLFGAFAVSPAQMMHHAAPPPPMPPPPPPPAATSGTSGAGPGMNGHPRGPAGGGAPSGMQIGPAGRWWDNNGYAKRVGLKHEQQQRMDAVFNANKATLFNTYRSLKSEEATLDSLKRAETPDEDRILAQIDKVAAMRGQLEKQSASLALQLRKELTPEQVKQLESPQ